MFGHRSIEPDLHLLDRVLLDGVVVLLGVHWEWEAVEGTCGRLRGAKLVGVAMTSMVSRASAMSKIGMIVMSFILKIEAKIEI